MTKFLVMSMCIGALVGAFGSRWFLPGVSGSVNLVAVGERVYDDKLHAVGYVRDRSGRVFLSLSDGRTVQPKNILFSPSGSFEAEVASGRWVKGGM